MVLHVTIAEITSSWYNDCCGVILYVRTIRYNTSRNVGSLKSVVHFHRQHWLVAGWLGPSVTGRVRVRARAREWGFPQTPYTTYCNEQCVHEG